MSAKDISMQQNSILDPADDAPDLTTLDLESGEWYIGERKVTAEEGKAAFRKAFAGFEAEPKASVTLRVDREVLEWFKRQGKGYQKRMNAVLKAYVKAHKAKATNG